MRWRDVQSRGGRLTPEDLDTLLKLDAEGRNLVCQAPGLYVSIWTAANRMAEDSPALGEIRQHQDAQARVALREGEGDIDWSRALSIYRAFPWAARAQSTLLDRADAALREGHAGLALRCYADVATRSLGEDLEFRARVGTWIALAQDPGNRRLLEAAVRRTGTGRSFPFLGRRRKAEEILQSLLRGSEGGPSRHPLLKAKLPSNWPRRELVLPGVEPWKIESDTELPLAFRAFLGGCIEPVSKDGKILISGPNLLACFEASREEPNWMHRSSVPLRFPEECLPAPAPFAPQVEGGRVYTRWGIESTGGRDVFPRTLKHLAAFDLSSGRPVWTTRPVKGWEELDPISDPVVADARLYVLAVEPHHPILAASLLLVCLDAPTGSLLWKRHLVTSSLCVKGRAGTDGGLSIDIARFGGSLAAVRGAVYCQTSAGVLARCDARDGMIEWVRQYQRDAETLPPASILLRHGGRPVVIDDVALFLPRDSISLLALSIDSGSIAWKMSRSECRWLLGPCGGNAILAGDEGLVAVDATSGETVWKGFPGPFVRRPQLFDGVVCAGTDGALFAIDGESGDVLAEWPWESTGIPHFLLAEESLVVFTNR
jgi:outer membrane protein assembly factor BamB